MQFSVVEYDVRGLGLGLGLGLGHELESTSGALY